MKLVMIKKNNKYYCRDNKQYPNSIPNEDKLRFNVSRLPSFSDRWIIFDELPTSVEMCIVGRNEVVEYRLKEGYDIINNIASVLPSDAFGCMQWDTDDDCVEWKNQDIKGLYEAVTEKQPDVWEPIELEVELIDEDCEPLVNPKYEFKVKFPYYIENHEVVRHKYPCYIEGKDVFQLIRDAVKKNLPDHCYVSSDYNFSFTVKVRAPIIHKETHQVDVSSFNARKPKIVDKPLREMQISVINIQTENKYSGTVIQNVNADNYEELEKKMDVLIQEYIDMMNWKPTVCPDCKGYGWI